MKRKLLALDLVLFAAIVAASWRLREDWLAARARERKLRQPAVRVVEPPRANLGSTPAPVSAVGYAEIAEKMLFSKDRNPTVVVEVPPAPPAKPMPALPVLYGVMNLSDGAAAIMGEKSASKQEIVRPGDKVGEFTLVAINSDEIALEWEGKPVTQKIQEMMVRNAPPEPAPEVPTRRGAPRPAAPSQQPTPKAEAAPGMDVGSGIRACQPGDASPTGTVAGGYRKRIVATPFGNTCRWDPI